MSFHYVFYYENLTLRSSIEEEILGVIINRKLTFHQHVYKVYRKAGQTFSALLRLPQYFDPNKRKTIYTSMVKSHLNYCPLVLVFYLRVSNSLIDKVQELAFRIT